MVQSRERTLKTILQPRPQILPSLLQCDFGRLADEIAEAETCGVQAVHWDVMDGHFVENLTYGPPVIEDLRPKSGLIFDAHLMIAKPEKYLDAFLAAGCDIITIHLEAVPDPANILKKIRQAGALAGLAINPPTAVESLEPWLPQTDVVNVMSVMPGFGGQDFDRSALDKIRWLRSSAGPNVAIEVDGGVNATTIADVTEAGATLLVVGSAFYGAKNRRSAYDSLLQATDHRPGTIN